MVSAFSVPKSKREYKYNDAPGPGQYNPQNVPKVIKPSDPKYSFGKQGRKQITTFVPGPGAYQVKQSYIIDKKPSYSMLARRQLKETKIEVGPGQYEPKYGYGKQKSPAYSMKGRSYSTLQSKPGPGQYQSISQFQKKNGSSFGRDSRIRDSVSRVPGPGSYDYQNAVLKYGSKNQPKYGFGSRIQIKNNSYVPGPGQYQPKKQVYSKIGGIMARDMHSSMILSKTPGPGSYDQLSYSKVKQKDPMWSMSKSSRQFVPRSDNVGPGQYDPDKNFKSVITSSPKYHFGTDKRINEYKNQVPGPGAYDQNLMKSRMSIKIGQKPKQMSSSYVPGPGQYQAQKYDNQSWLKGQGRYSLGRSAREFAVKSQVPGPGQYENPITKIKQPKGKITFGKDSRVKLQNKNVPGPGSYILKPTFADVPKYLLPNKN